MSELSVEIVPVPGHVRTAHVKLRGRLEPCNLLSFEDSMRPTVEAGFNRILLDLTEALIVGSSVAGLMGWLEELNDRDGCLALLNPHRAILTLLRALEVLPRFHIFSSEAEALAFLGRCGAENSNAG